MLSIGILFSGSNGEYPVFSITCRTSRNVIAIISIITLDLIVFEIEKFFSNA